MPVPDGRHSALRLLSDRRAPADRCKVPQGPLVFYLKYPDGLLWFGLLLTGFIQWPYVIPAIVVAKRMGKPGFRDGALGAAVILLVLDLAGIALVAFIAQALRGLR